MRAGLEPRCSVQECVGEEGLSPDVQGESELWRRRGVSLHCTLHS